MSSRFRKIALKIALALWVMAAPTATQAEDLRICADPANLPFSDKQGHGFEDKIAALVGGVLNANVSFVWWNDRRATAIEAMNSGKCDIVPGAVTGMNGVDTTEPWLSSGYAFVTRSAQGPVSSFDDPALRHMKIGVQSIGDEATTPPVAALLKRRLGANLEPYTLRGHYNDPNSASQIVADVASGKLGAAVLWGPFAGYFAALEKTPLSVTLVELSPGDPPMQFSIAMAARRGDGDLVKRINAALIAKRAEIAAILDSYGVPRIDFPENALLGKETQR
jgi:mxaJ protein